MAASRTRRLEQFFPVVTHERPSSRADDELEQTLTEFMRENVPVEVKSELQRRERVLGQLRAIFVDWVKKVCLAKGLPEELASEAGGQLYTSGSYRLGVHEPGADIDTVCVAPQHCTREDFFASLRATLEAHPQVTGLTGIDTAAVPIMTFDFERVNIDLLFAALPLNAVPPTLDIDDDFVLQGVDTATEKSLNGPRVTNLIVALVPAFDAFLPVLRCVRRWAKARGLYGNKLGYLGGVNWCILVALVCQLYPKGTPAYLLNRFFRVLAQWQWPNPIHLCPPAQNSTLGYEVWDPRAQYNRYHLMPIITPAYPAMNSSVSVNQWTLEVMREEFNRGHELAQKAAAAAGSLGEVGGERWSELFEPTDFFCRYPHYLALNVVARDEPGQRAWGGFVESRLRKLLDHLGRALPLRRLHLCPLKFKRCTIPLEETLPATEAQKDTGDEGKTGDGDEEKTTVIERQGFSYFIAFELDNKRLEGQTISIDGPVQTFKQYELARYNAFEEGMDLVVQHSQWKQLPEWVFESLGGKAQAKLVHKSYVRQRKEKERSERAAAQEKARAAQEAAARAAAQAQGGVEDVEEGKEEDMEPSGKRKYEEFADGSVHPNEKAAELKRSKKLEDGSAEQGEQVAVIPLVEEDVVQGDLAKDIGQVSTVGLEEEKDKPTAEVPQAGRVEDGKAIFSTDEVAHPNLRVSLKELPPFTDPPDLFQLGYALNKSQKSSTFLSQERQFTEPFQVVFELLPRR